MKVLAWKPQVNLNRNVSAYVFLVLLVGFTSIAKVRSYHPYTEGWWSSYSSLMRQGLVPYRDFELLTPPGFVYITRAVESLVGTNFLALRYVGALVQICIALLVFKILQRKTTVFIAFISTVFSNIYLYSNVAAITFDYNYFAILMLLTGFNFYDSDRRLSPSIDLCLKYSAGLFFGFSFLIKQSFAFTTLIFLLVGSLAPTVLRERSNLKNKLSEGLSFVFGFITPIMGFTLYAIQGHFLSSFLHDVFHSSVKAKGSLLKVLFGWVPNSFRYFEVHGDFSKNYIFATTFIFAYQYVKRLAKRGTPELSRILNVIDKMLLVMAGAVSIASLRDVYFRESSAYLESIIQNAPAFPILGNHPVIPLFFTGGWLVLVFRKMKTEFTNLFGLVLGIVWACALSGGIDQFGMFLGLGVLLVLLSKYAKGKTLLLPICTLLLAIWVAGFNNAWILNPYSWWGYRTSSVSEANVVSKQPYSKGLYSDPYSNLHYSELIDFAKLNLKCSKIMLTFPSMTSFSLDAGYKPYLNQVQYWYDFTSREKVEEVIDSIASNRPPVILYTKYPTDVAKAHSQGFNQGHPYPQQELERKIVKLMREEYVSKSYDIYGSDGFSVTLAIKKSCL